jgi:hypothetical protein
LAYSLKIHFFNQNFRPKKTKPAGKNKKSPTKTKNFSTPTDKKKLKSITKPKKTPFSLKQSLFQSFFFMPPPTT